MPIMTKIREVTHPESTAPAAEQSGVDLVSLSAEWGVSIETLRTFEAISNPANRHLFTVDAALKAFANVKTGGARGKQSKRR